MLCSDSERWYTAGRTQPSTGLWQRWMRAVEVRGSGMDWRTFIARPMVCSLGDSALLDTPESILVSGDDTDGPVASG